MVGSWLSSAPSHNGAGLRALAFAAASQSRQAVAAITDANLRAGCAGYLKPSIHSALDAERVGVRKSLSVVSHGANLWRPP